MGFCLLSDDYSIVKKENTLILYVMVQFMVGLKDM